MASLTAQAIQVCELDGQPVNPANGHDDGRKSFERGWLIGSRGDARPFGIHKSYDAEGRPRGERSHDAIGRISRERDRDEAARTTRDDEVFEVGSRKACAR